MNNNKKCLQCKEFFPTLDSIKSNIGWFHSIECMSEYGLKKSRKLKEKKEKSAHTKRKKELNENDRSLQVKKTQQIFNKYIRVRDDAESCISCNRYHTGQYHAGHYRTVGANPELRFTEFNCHKQCAPCNNHLGGNIVNYRINLLHKLGPEMVEWLEGYHPPKRYTIENLNTLQKWFKRKTRRLENAKNYTI